MVAGHKPTTFDDAVDRVFTAEEIHREKTAANTKISGDSWFKNGGQSKDKRQKQRFVARNERNGNRPVCENCGKAHRTDLCWRTTGACVVRGSLEQKMTQCPRARRDTKAPYQHSAQGQAVLLTPPQRLTLPAPSRQQEQQPQRHGQQRQWQQREQPRQQQPNRPQMAGMAYAINREQADVAAYLVEGTILVDNRPAIALFDSGSAYSFVAPTFACD